MSALSSLDLLTRLTPWPRCTETSPVTWCSWLLPTCWYQPSVRRRCRPPRDARHHHRHHLCRVTVTTAAVEPVATPPGHRPWRRLRLCPLPARPLPRSQPDCCGPDPQRAPGGHVTRRGASARRRGCRGGRAWRRTGPDGCQRSLLMGLINVQSLLPKIAALQHDHLNRLHYDICVLTETWLRSATPSRLVTFPGYALHRADRPGDAGYGGVAVLARDKLRGDSHPTAGVRLCGLLAEVALAARQACVRPAVHHRRCLPTPAACSGGRPCGR